MSIRRKLILSISLPLLATYAALLGWDYYRQRAGAMEQMQALVIERAQSAAAHLDAQLAGVAQLADAQAQALAERADLAEPAVRAMLAGSARQNRRVVGSIVLLDRQPNAASAAGGPATGVALSTRRSGGSGGGGGGGGGGPGGGGPGRVIELSPEDVAARPWLARARELRKGLWSDAHEDADARRWVCTYATPVMRDDAVVGVVAMSVPADIDAYRPRAEEMTRFGRGFRFDRAGTGTGAGGGGPGARPERRGATTGPQEGDGRRQEGRWEDRQNDRRDRGETFGEPLREPSREPSREPLREPLGTSTSRANLPASVPPPPPRGGDPATREAAVAPDLATAPPAPEGIALLDAQGRLIGSDGDRGPRGRSLIDDAERAGRQEVADVARAALAGQSGVARVADLHEVVPHFSTDHHHWIAFVPIPATGWVLSAAISESSVMDPVLSRLWQRAAFLAAGMVVLLAVVLLVSIRISRPIERLAGAVDRLAAGDLEATVTGVRGRDELARLAGGFNDMTRQLRTHVAALTEHAAAREKAESEMRIARQIQTDLLPRTFPPFPQRAEFQLHATNVPAMHVAGDFYDFFFTTPQLLTMVIADVAGKGVPAALLMAVTRTIVRNLASAGLCPREIVERANTMLVQDTNATMFVTMFLCQYEPATGQFQYVNAGHPRPARLSATSPPRWLGEATSPLVGVSCDGDLGPFVQHEDQLEPGETLLMFTDGVSEARSPSGDMLGDAGTLSLIARHATLPPRALCEAVVGAVDLYQSRQRRDDLTLVALRRERSP